MEFNKCTQCGSFFASSGKICPNCIQKDNIKIQKLENYLENYSIPDTVHELAVNTGIPSKDLSRLINQNSQFSKLQGKTF